MTLREYLKEHKIMMDGAMGTYYGEISKEHGTISELANITTPEIILDIHKRYLRAGTTMIRTNTFAANRMTLQMERERQSEVIKKACNLAKLAVKQYKEEVQQAKHLFVGGSIGPMLGAGERSEQEILEEYKEICDIFIEEQVDAIVFETSANFNYIEPLVQYIRQKSDIFIMANFSLNKNGYTTSGISAKRIIEGLENIPEIDAGGFNCGIGSRHMYQLLSEASLSKKFYIAVLPNAGYPEQMQNRMVFMNNTAYFVENMKKISKLGVSFIGGCCGTTPEYIKALGEAIDCSVKAKVPHIILHGASLEEPAEREDNGKPLSRKENKFYEKLSRGEKVIAVELDPPYDASYEKLIEHAFTLKRSGVDIITLADSPMGRSRVDSLLMSVKIASETGMEVMPHVCCRDKNMIAMRSGLLGAYINDIRNILIVTGDPVPSVNRTSTTSVFDYNSIQLMNFVKEMNQEHFQGDPFFYGGALNYGRGFLDKVIERMEKKIAGGASYFLTQPIYAEQDMERIREIKKRVNTKILCGIMPLVSYRNANFIKNEITGIYVPDEIVAQYNSDMTKEEAEWVGAEIASKIIEKIDDFADGYYFMLPFNRVSLMDKIKFPDSVAKCHR